MKVKHLFDNWDEIFIPYSSRNQMAIKSFAHHSRIKITTKRVVVCDGERSYYLLRCTKQGEIKRKEYEQRFKYQIEENKFRNLFEISEFFKVSYSTFRKRLIKKENEMIYNGVTIREI